MSYASGMAGFAQWLSADPQGAQLYARIACPLTAQSACLWQTCGAVDALPSDAVNSAQLAPAAASLLTCALATLPSCQQPAAAAAVDTQLQRAAAGQPPLNVGLLELGATRIKLGATCFYFGATELQGGDLLLVLAGGALLVGLLLFHGRKKRAGS